MKKHFVILLAAFLITPLAVGHGFAPFALALVFGNMKTWGTVRFYGSVAVIVVIVSAYLKGKTQRCVSIIGLITAYVSWIIAANTAAENSGAPFRIQLIYSVLFQLGVINFIVQLVRTSKE